MFPSAGTQTPLTHFNHVSGVDRIEVVAARWRKGIDEHTLSSREGEHTQEKLHNTPIPISLTRCDRT